jgi:FtsH-binding integral membrane protein
MRTTTYASDAESVHSGLASHMSAVYRNLTMGLGLTAMIAWLFGATPLAHLIYRHAEGAHGVTFTGLGWIALLAPLVMLLVAVVANPGRWSHGALLGFYVAFTAMFGVSMSSVLLVYSHVDILRALLATIAGFAGLSIAGYLTKRDLSGMGAACHMALWGLIAVGFIGIFSGSHMLQMVQAGVSVLVFAGLTAYDTQDAKNRYLANPTDSARIAVWSALELFLDFLNLFLDLLKLTGGEGDGGSILDGIGNLFSDD